MSQPRPQGSPYTLPTAVRLSADVSYARETSLSKNATSSAYVTNGGSENNIVIGNQGIGNAVAFEVAPSSAIPAIDYPSVVPVGYVTPPPPVLGFKYTQFTCPANPVVVNSNATVDVWSQFTNLPANMAGVFLLEVYCTTTASYTFTGLGYLQTNGVGVVQYAFGFGGNSFLPTQNGTAVATAIGAALVSGAAPAVGLYQYTTAGTAQSFNLTLRSLANA